MPLLLQGARNPKINPGGTGYLDVSRAIRVLDRPAGNVDRSGGDVHPAGSRHSPSRAPRRARLEPVRHRPAPAARVARKTGCSRGTRDHGCLRVQLVHREDEPAHALARPACRGDRVGVRSARAGEIEGAGAHAFHRRFDRPHTGNHDHQRLLCPGLQLSKQIRAFSVGKAHIGDDQVETVFAQIASSVGHGLAGGHFVTAAAQLLFEVFSHHRFVFKEENLFDSHILCRLTGFATPVPAPRGPSSSFPSAKA